VHRCINYFLLRDKDSSPVYRSDISWESLNLEAPLVTVILDGDCRDSEYKNYDWIEYKILRNKSVEWRNKYTK